MIQENIGGGQIKNQGPGKNNNGIRIPAGCFNTGQGRYWEERERIFPVKPEIR
jgi:hypothetical protein